MNRKQLLNSTFVGCGKLKVPSRRMFAKEISLKFVPPLGHAVGKK